MSARYVLKEGLSGFRRAKLSAAGSMVTIMLALMLLGSAGESKLKPVDGSSATVLAERSPYRPSCEMVTDPPMPLAPGTVAVFNTISCFAVKVKVWLPTCAPVVSQK